MCMVSAYSLSTAPPGPMRDPVTEARGPCRHTQLPFGLSVTSSFVCRVFRYLEVQKRHPALVAAACRPALDRAACSQAAFSFAVELLLLTGWLGPLPSELFALTVMFKPRG